MKKVSLCAIAVFALSFGANGSEMSFLDKAKKAFEGGKVALDLKIACDVSLSAKSKTINYDMNDSCRKEISKTKSKLEEGENTKVLVSQINDFISKYNEN